MFAVLIPGDASVLTVSTIVCVIVVLGCGIFAADSFRIVLK